MYDWKTFTYHQELRVGFKNGWLHRDWAKRYPELFDADDRRLAESQAGKGSHFFEWFAAIRVYEATQHLSLLEKYHFQRHEAKFALFTRLVPQDLVSLLCFNKRFGSRGGPDLLCYRPNSPDWFFCEVKGPGDEVRPAQLEVFQAIEEIVEEPIRLVTIEKVLE